MKTVLIFRFACREVTEPDQELLSKVSSNLNENTTLETTENGVIVVAKTKMSVDAILFKYKMLEKKYKVKLPVFIINLNEPQSKINASFINLSEMIRKVKEDNMTIQADEPKAKEKAKSKTINELLEQIYDKGLVSLTEEERIQLDEYSKKLK